MNTQIPSKLEVKARSGLLLIGYQDGSEYELSFEFLRVFSPSAEVRGHGVGNEVLQYGKRRILIEGIEPVGNYAIKIVFSDGHDSGIYSWDILDRYCREKDSLWTGYLEKLEAAGKSRDS